MDDFFGGAIPKNWIPSVESGIRESAERGYLAGFPVTDFRATLYDGKYHDVDSSDMAFKIAGSLAFKEAMKQARPALLEPVMHVEIYAPDQYSGDLMGNLSSAARKNQRQRNACGKRGDQSAGAAFGNAQLRKRIDVDDAGTRQLLDGIFALRFRPRRASGKSDRGAQAASHSRRRRSRLGIIEAPTTRVLKGRAI